MREAAKTPGKKLAVNSTENKTIPAYRDRQCIVITNYGAKPVTYALGSAVTSEEGPSLAKEGGTVVLEGYSGPVTFKTSAETSVVGWTEF